VSLKTPSLILPADEAHALWAESYDRNPNALLALEQRVIEPLLPSLEQKVILDVACGTGRWLANLLGRGATFGLGLDASREMLQQARRKNSIQGNLVRGDCTALPIHSCAIDFAICSFATSYFADLRRFAQELSKIMRPAASLFLTDFHPSAHLRGWKRAFRHNDVVVEAASFHYSIDDVCDNFIAEGFELLTRVEACFGEGERHVFDQCGKGHLLDQLSREPAIFICHFKI
jgi:ubiquinone/menaquinone biosynthesis C-methylase UbiE